MLYIVLGMLNELRPVWFYVLAAGLFVLSQLAGFLLSKVICKVRVPCLQLRPSRVPSPLPIPPVPFSALRGFSVNLETNERPVCCLVPCAEYERENRRVVHRDDPGDRKCRGIVLRVEKHNRRSVNQDFLMLPVFCGAPH